MRLMRIGRGLALAAGLCAAASCGGGASLTMPTEANPPIQMADSMENLERALAQQSGSVADREEYAARVRQKREAAFALGEKLFKDPRLGGATRGQSCESCHPGGGTSEGRGQVPRTAGRGPFYLDVPPLTAAAAEFPKYSMTHDAVISLGESINTCLDIFVGGARLPLNGPRLRALVAYVSRFSNGRPVMVGGEAPEAAAEER